MVFIRPTITRDTAGLEAISGKKYSDIHILNSQNPKLSNRLAEKSSKRFDGQSEPVIDVRNP